jgi:hypothetical protein
MQEIVGHRGDARRALRVSFICAPVVFILFTFFLSGPFAKATEKNLKEPNELEIFLRANGFRINTFDQKPVFDTYTEYFSRDDVYSTPTCVIEKDGRTDKYTERDSIVEALKKLVK